jgi:murein DD-endopeptidase MepM/ murein hydrolase activator NlpD
MKRWKKLKDKFKEQYDFIVINKKTLERKGTYKFTVGSIILFGIGSVFLIVLFTSLIIVFTPLRELIPGYTDKSLKEERKALLKLVHKMEGKIASQDSFIKSMQKMTGLSAVSNPGAPASTTSMPSSNETSENQAHQTPPSTIAEVAGPTKGTSIPILLFPPVEGRITRRYNPAEGHWAIDLVANENASIFSVAKGIIFFADYTIQTGYVLGVLHDNDMVSFYKHCKQLLKKPGSIVQAGEMIATVGNSGEQSTGPHLHFELWKKGASLNPEDFFQYTR